MPNFREAAEVLRGPPSIPASASSHLPILLFFEGPHDVEFLTRMSRLLQPNHLQLPDLTAVVDAGLAICLPVGGNGPQPWMSEIGRLGKSEFHLFDREIEPVTAIRRLAISRLNARPGCRAFLTTKRSLENYLHPQAIAAALGIEIEDDTAVPDLVAQKLYELSAPSTPWQDLGQRTQKRLRNRAKHHLNGRVVEQMTPALLAKRDPEGELIHWIATIASLIRGE